MKSCVGEYFVGSHKETKPYQSLAFAWFSFFNVNKFIAKLLSTISFLNCLCFNMDEIPASCLPFLNA